MSDFQSEGDKKIKLAPEKEHRIRCIDALYNLVNLDEQPQDLVQMIFSKEELLWLKQNLHT